MSDIRTSFTSFLTLVFSLMVSYQTIGQETEAPVTYENVKPILAKRCVSCHGRNDPQSGLDLTSVEGLMAGSESGPIVVAGEPDQSLLYTLAAHIEEPIMPPGKERIPAAEVETLRGWIASGLIRRAGEESSASSMEVAATSRQPIEEIQPLARPTAITALAVNPNGETLAVSGIQQVVLLSQDTLRPIHAYPFPEGEVFDLQFSNGGDWLVIAGGKGGASGRVVIVDVATGQRLIETQEERDVVLCCDLTPDKRFLAWGGPWKTVQVMSVASKKLVHTLEGPTDWILDVALSSDGRLVAGADRFGGLRVWNMLTGKEFWNLRGHTGAVTSIRWSPDQDRLLSTGIDGSCRVWDLHAGEESKSFEVGDSEKWVSAWSNENLIAVGGRKEQLYLINDTDGRRIAQIDLEDDPTELTFSSDGVKVFVANVIGQISRYDVVQAKLEATTTLPIAESLVNVEFPWPPRTRPVRETALVMANAAPTPEENIELALRETEEAISATEATLEKLKMTADRLRSTLDAVRSGR